MDPAAFWHMTMADYIRKCIGYGKRQAAQWHHTRAIAFTFYRTMGGKEPAHKFMPLEDDTNIEQIDQAKVDAVRENIKKIKEIYNR